MPTNLSSIRDSSRSTSASCGTPVPWSRRARRSPRSTPFPACPPVSAMTGCSPAASKSIWTAALELAPAGSTTTGCVMPRLQMSQVQAWAIGATRKSTPLFTRKWFASSTRTASPSAPTLPSIVPWIGSSILMPWLSRSNPIPACATASSTPTFRPRARPRRDGHPTERIRRRLPGNATRIPLVDRGFLRGQLRPQTRPEPGTAQNSQLARYSLVRRVRLLRQPGCRPLRPVGFGSAPDRQRHLRLAPLRNGRSRRYAHRPAQLHCLGIAPDVLGKQDRFARGKQESRHCDLGPRPLRYPHRRSQKPEMPDDFVRWRSGLQFARLVRNNYSPLT